MHKPLARPRARRAPPLIAALVLAACARSEGPTTLVDKPALQEVVELQVARDAGALAERLEGRSAVVRARAALALASVQSQNAATALIEALDDGEAVVRANAAF